VREVCALAFAASAGGGMGDAEHRALVAPREEDGAGRLAGVVLFGDWAGTLGGARLHAVAGGAAREALLAAAASACRSRGARYLLAEMPDEPPLRAVLDALRAAAFVEMARVPDLVRDGVDLVMLERAL
jgi:hypothetical protein